MELQTSDFEVACYNAGGKIETIEQRHKDEHGMVYQHTHDSVCDLGDRGEIALIEEPAPADSTLSGRVDGELIEAFGVDDKFRDVHMVDGRLVIDGKRI